MTLVDHAAKVIGDNQIFEREKQKQFLLLSFKYPITFAA